MGCAQILTRAPLIGLFILVVAACDGSTARPSATRPPTASCRRATCPSLDVDCGDVMDGCGGVLRCGACAGGLTCGGGGTPNRCGDGSCTAAACGADTCGQLSDGCGAVLECGGCTAPNVCGGGGANVCGCQPTTCVAVAAGCGQVSDRCGGLLACGDCPGAQTCGGGGTANQCGDGPCTPTTCAAQGASCGSIADGCGAVLDCGQCTGNLACGADNVCRQPMCTPVSCQQQGKNCGAADDGCGVVLQCGACTAPQTCGGAGTANVCGDVPCQGRSCADANAQCGMVSDGCGNMLACGDCAAPLSCGGAGTANECGASCDRCPAGFSCDSNGVCTGGDAQTLHLDVVAPPLVTVSGNVRLNGSTPSTGWSSSSCARVYFHNLDDLDDVTVTAPCAGTSAFAYSASIHAGSYRIEVEDYQGHSELPSTRFETHASLRIAATRTLDLDVIAPPLVQITGAITLNGTQPATGWSSSACARVRFDNADAWDSVSVTAPCAGSSAFGYTATLHAGTYRVTVEDYQGHSELPSTAFEVYSARVIAGGGNLDLDVTAPPLVDVSGAITLNGGQPGTGWSSSSCARVRFNNLDDLDSVAVTAPCAGTSAFRYTARLHAGRYEVVVEDYQGHSALPSTGFEVHSQLSISGTRTLDLNVTAPALVQLTGSITLNGAQPSTGWSSSSCARVRFNNLDGLDSVSVTAPCAGTSAFIYSASVLAGNYDILVEDYQGHSALPSTPRPIHMSRAIGGSQSLNLDVTAPPLVELTGAITLNGVQPATGWSSSSCARVRFDNLDGLDSIAVTAPCAGTSAFRYTATVHAGRYEIEVEDYQGHSALPTARYTAHAMLSISGPRTLDLDVTAPPLVAVAGWITLNNATPSTGWSSSSCARVRFENLDGLDDLSITAPCAGGSAFRFDVRLHAGTYRITVEDYQGHSELPTTRYTVAERIRLP